MVCGCGVCKGVRWCEWAGMAGVRGCVHVGIQGQRAWACVRVRAWCCRVLRAGVAWVSPSDMKHKKKKDIQHLRAAGVGVQWRAMACEGRCACGVRVLSLC